MEVPAMTDWFFDRSGQIRLFLYNDRFISEQGDNLGWLAGNTVYSLTGNHIGWLERGVLHDENNDILAFSTKGSGHLPSRPGIGGVLETPEIPQSPPRPGLTGVPERPCYGGWSNKTLEQFFSVPLNGEASRCRVAGAGRSPSSTPQPGGLL
jgi:hypothetical protein